MQIVPAGFKDIVRSQLNEEPLAALENLAIQINGITLFDAGIPYYRFNFTRDSILSAILFENPLMLKDQLIFCSLLQGSRNDPYTGEEPGKIFHQMPGKIQRNLSTEYNACDTTALFIYGHEVYLKLTNDYYFIEKQKKYIIRSVDYILRHLVNYLFVEDPKFSGSKKFGLKLTYWKDSQVPNRIDGYPAYPAVFTLAHVQNMKALRSAAKILASPDLYATADQMKRHLSILFDEKHGVFHSGVDQKGFFPGITSDNLHMFYYLDAGDISGDKINKILNNTKKLETPLGYMTMDTKDKWLAGDITNHTSYHTDTVWPFEQAFIHMGARKFGLDAVMKIAERIFPMIKNTYPELFVKTEKDFHKKGSELQLWTVAASVYFEKYFQSVNSSK